MGRHLQIPWDLNDEYQRALAEAFEAMPKGTRNILVTKMAALVLGSSEDPDTILHRLKLLLYRPHVLLNGNLQDKQKRHEEGSKPLSRQEPSKPLSPAPKSEPLQKPPPSEPLQKRGRGRPRKHPLPDSSAAPRRADSQAAADPLSLTHGQNVQPGA